MADPGSTAFDLWTRARARFRARDYAEAADLLAELVERSGEDSRIRPATLRLQYGVTLLRLGRTEEGVAELRLAVELDPANPRAHQKLGAGLARLGRDVEALPYLERAAAMSPGDAEYQWRGGEQYRRLGRLASARDAFERSLAIDPAFRPASEGLQAMARNKGSWLKRLARTWRGRRTA